MSEYKKLTPQGRDCSMFLEDRKSLAGQEKQYVVVPVSAYKVVQDWRKSLFSYEWLDREGNIRSLTDLKDSDRAKREAVEKALSMGSMLKRPVLGIGINDNVEIGAGKDVFLTLAANGYDPIPVHIHASNKDLFEGFMI